MSGDDLVTMLDEILLPGWRSAIHGPNRPSLAKQSRSRKVSQDALCQVADGVDHVNVYALDDGTVTIGDTGF
jgi:hypothetical protein